MDAKQQVKEDVRLEPAWIDLEVFLPVYEYVGRKRVREPLTEYERRVNLRAETYNHSEDLYMDCRVREVMGSRNIIGWGWSTISVRPEAITAHGPGAYGWFVVVNGERFETRYGREKIKNMIRVRIHRRLDSNDKSTFLNTTFDVNPSAITMVGDVQAFDNTFVVQIAGVLFSVHGDFHSEILAALRMNE